MKSADVLSAIALRTAGWRTTLATYFEKLSTSEKDVARTLASAPDDTTRSAQAISGAGAVSLGAVSLTQELTTINLTGAGAATGTLAAGAENQRKRILMLAATGGTYALTVTNLAVGTTLTFNAAEDFIELLYINAKWHVTSNTSVTVA